MIVDGDIYRWRYKDEKPEHLAAWGRYHCKSRIAIANAGRLFDTYWGGFGSDSARWTYADAEAQLELTRLGNFSELEKRPDYETMYYDAADIVDLRHPNSSRDNVYIRKGAPRSKAKMLSVLLERVETSERELNYAKLRIERDRERIAAIERGDDLNGVYL